MYIYIHIIHSHTHTHTHTRRHIHTHTYILEMSYIQSHKHARYVHLSATKNGRVEITSQTQYVVVRPSVLPSTCATRRQLKVSLPRRVLGVAPDSICATGTEKAWPSSNNGSSSNDSGSSSCSSNATVEQADGERNGCVRSIIPRTHGPG